MADWCEVLAALDGGVSSCRVSSRRLLDIFHFHFFMMYPKIGRPEVLLTALPLAHTVRGPFPKERSERADVEWFSPMVCPIFPYSVQVASRAKKQKDSLEESNETPKLADLSWLSFLFSPQSLSTFLVDAELNPQGPRCLPEAFLQLQQLEIHAQGDNGLEGAICQSLEVGIRYLTATSVSEINERVALKGQIEIKRPECVPTAKIGA